MNVYLSFLIGVLSGVICAYFAVRRGRSGQIWFLVGLFFGFLALAALFLLPRVVEDSEEEEQEDEEPIVPKEPLTLVSLPPDPLHQEWFFLDQARTQKGPVAFSELIAAWRDRLINEQSYVWTEGMVDWQPIASLPLLLEKLK